jgi:hypothetical protein
MIDTMDSLTQQTAAPPIYSRGTVTVSIPANWKSEAGIDTALLVCALFLQRFSLSFGTSLMSLDVVPALCLLINQFVAGRLLIVYNRLLWFFVLGLAATCSLLLNFHITMLPSYSEFMVLYFLFTLSRPSTCERYKSTLQAFQFLALVLCWLGIAQFLAQFVVDGRKLVNFYNIIPDYLLASYNTGVVNTIIPVTPASGMIKSNGIFLTEPSTLSQIAALGILIELLEFRRRLYLLPLSFGFLLSYSGTGLMTLVLFLPFAGFARKRMVWYLVLVILFGVGLSVTGLVDFSIFLARMGEFQDTHASGFMRFVAPFWLVPDYLKLVSPRALLLGNGPGTTGAFVNGIWYSGGVTCTWIKLFYEYGVVGAFVFILFLAACFRRTLCPSVVFVAVLFTYVFLGGNLLTTPFLILMIVLLTLSAPERRRSHIDTINLHQPFLMTKARES